MAIQSTVATNKEFVREFVQRVFNEHNPDVASEYYLPEATWHGGILGTVEGIENVIGVLRGSIGAFPDLHATELDMVAEQDTVVVRLVVEGTHEGNLFGIPATSRRVRWDAVDIYRLSDGKIAEEWAADDTAAVLYQVGAFVPPWLK
jgi:predicted ester cyclase